MELMLFYNGKMIIIGEKWPESGPGIRLNYDYVFYEKARREELKELYLQAE